MNKKFKLLVSSLIFVILLVSNREVEAATKQTSATKDSITVTWDAEDGALNYQVHVGIMNPETYKTEYTQYAVVPNTQTSITINSLTAGKEYDIKVTYDYQLYNGDITNYIAGTAWDSFTLPGKVTGVYTSEWYNSLKQLNISWDEMEAADGYQYVVKDSKGKKKASKTIEGKYINYATIKKVNNSTIYTAQVRAYKDYNGQRVWGDWSEKIRCLAQPSIKTLKVSNKKLKLTWTKVNGNTGYDIYISTTKDKGYKKVKSVSKKSTSVTISKFKGKKFSSKKTYYVYVVAKKKVGKTTYKSPLMYYSYNY